ncbi:MAG: F0F1 ATP synthase subunit A [Gemmatimonadetes bacterium]|mgnify:FL=1|nr:F0F1 ATP synthase subunit A [Gemmatimonadota bacterium]MBT6146500.1 F0F1 ATP synthase subunit A [Gemmatimonadota bacterium]
MADANAGASADGQVDVIGHILDHDYLEVPFLNAHHFIDGRLDLPGFDPIFGIDLSITRHVVWMWLASGLLITTLIACFGRPKLVPTGLANALEAIVLFIRDEVVVPVMGQGGRVYMPFLLTTFFFILYCNLLGLVPYSATPTGNISVTLALALISFVVTQGAGIANNGLFGHIKALVPGGMPAPLLIIMIPIEIIGLVAKPFALCIRLFANMIAGHVAILVFLGLIIMLQSLWIAPVSVVLAAALYLLEIFIGFVQAFIFTLLTALFVNMAAHPEH